MLKPLLIILLTGFFIRCCAGVDLLLLCRIIVVHHHQRNVLAVFACIARFGALANESVLVVAVIEIETLTECFVLV